MQNSEFADNQSENSFARAKLDQQLVVAAEALLADYVLDRELTAFSVLDAEEFYPAEWDS